LSVSGILIIDKPQGFTSQDVVAVVRRTFSMRRVGHTGTLDPMATGLLIVCLGRATRAVDFLMGGQKVYEAGFRLGIKTDTGDITGSEISSSLVTPSPGELKGAISRFIGTSEQIPPMYSAIKKDGVPLYKLARRGQEVERSPRKIEIERLELLEYDQKAREGRLLVACSKGTYIRTLIEDIAAAAGAQATMSALRRVQNGRFGLEQAITLERLAGLAGLGRQREALLPTDRAFEQEPAITLDKKAAGFIKNGREVEVSAADGRYRVYSADGEFLGISGVQRGRLRVIKSFFETDV
jgi:tRNA pseudouridine55 synthase